MANNFENDAEIYTKMKIGKNNPNRRKKHFYNSFYTTFLFCKNFINKRIEEGEISFEAAAKLGGSTFISFSFSSELKNSKFS